MKSSRLHVDQRKCLEIYTPTLKILLTRPPGKLYKNRTKSAAMAIIIRILNMSHLKFLQNMYLKVFIGLKSHKNEVSGRLKKVQEQLMNNENHSGLHCLSLWSAPMYSARYHAIV